MIRQLLGRMRTAVKVAAGLKLDAFDLLRRDHMKVEKRAIELRLIKDPNRRRHLLDEIRNILDRHMKIEEEILYPTCMRIGRLSRLIDHAHTDHQLAKNALKDLVVMSPTNSRYNELVTKVIKEFEHHVYEEENMILGGAKKFMSARSFNEMNRRILQAYESPHITDQAA